MAALSRGPTRHLTRRRLAVVISLIVAAGCGGFAVILALEGLWIGAAVFAAVAAANCWFAYRPPPQPPHPVVGTLVALAVGVVVLLLAVRIGREVVALLALGALAVMAPVGAVLVLVALLGHSRRGRPR